MRTDRVIFPCTRVMPCWACTHTYTLVRVAGRVLRAGCVARHSVPSEGAAVSSKRNKSRFLLGKTLQTPISQTSKQNQKKRPTSEQTQEWSKTVKKNTLAVTNKFWILTSCVCFLDFLWSRGVCGVLGWLAGKVVYRFASFTFFKKNNFLDFYLKPKSLTLKEKNLKPKNASWVRN